MATLKQTASNIPRREITNPAPAAPSHASTATARPQIPTGGKVTLFIGVVVALALANTEAAPLIDALLVAGIVYQIIQITGGKA